MANPPTPSKGTDSSPGANGKTGRIGDRSGPYDPKPGAAVKGKGRTETASVPTAAEVQARRAERRPDLIKKRREEHRRLPEKRQRQRLYKRIGAGVLAVVLVAAIAFGIYNASQGGNNHPLPAWSGNANLNQMPANVITYTDAVWTARDHNDTYSGWPDVDKHPPVGGTHNQIWQNCGYYDKPIANEHAVHSLEHGAVWITYRSDLPQDQIDKLKGLAEDQPYILVSPYENQPTPVVATAWDHQLDLQTVDDTDLGRFVATFKDNATYTPEMGAVCTGGVSDTVG
jgi:uncharacterized protein DUF3105